MPESIRSVAHRVFPDDCSLGRMDGSAWLRGDWPARWVSCPGAPSVPQVALYRLMFRVPHRTGVRIHVTADERYTLHLDGRRIGRGSQRGSPWRWHFESYDLRLAAGPHTLVARVWSLGEAAPVAQMRVGKGFLLMAEGEEQKRLSTGHAAWKTRALPGRRFAGGPLTWGSGYDEVMELRAAESGWERGGGPGWRAAVPGPVGTDFAVNADRIGLVHRLAPATLPPLLSRPVRGGRVRHIDAVPGVRTRAVAVRAADHFANEVAAWQAWWDGGALNIPPRTTRRAIIDLGDYFCAYPVLRLRGGRGARVRMHWAEALYEAKTDPALADDHLWNRPKGHRDVIEGKFFVGHGPSWRVADGGGHVADTLWWQAGRFVEIHVQTGAKAMILEAPRLEETRYPLELESRFATDDVRLDAMQPVLARGLQMCAHETYMDCPYWEQLMYAGDTRLQALCGYTMTRDDRLQRQALRLFDDSRLPTGLTQSRFPCSNGQVIPPFSLHWIGMLHEHALWRGDASLVRELLPGVRSVLEAHLQPRRPGRLLGPLPGWNFVDWVPGWKSGEPPTAKDRLSSVLMGQLVIALRQAADLEDYAGQPPCAARWRGEARALASAIRSTFWHERRGCLADDTEHRSCSEHAQALALLGGILAPTEARRALDALADGRLDHAATIYFSHYVFEALAAAGRAVAFHRRLDLWKHLPEQGFRTPYEAPGNTRSDCHAWSSHPLYHLFASIAGIRPSAIGSGAVTIRPMLGPLHRIDADLAHPCGRIRLRIRAGERRTNFDITLPKGVTGHLVWKGRRHALSGTRKEFVL